MNEPFQVEDSLRRKDKNEQFLNSIGVPVNKHLPYVEGENVTRLRTPQEVAKRAIVLYVIVLVANGFDNKQFSDWLKKESLWESVSKSEKQFLESNNPDKSSIRNNSWRAESLWVLLWALSKIETLELPMDLCDPPLVQSILPEFECDCYAFIEKAALRSVSEILDATDLIYRIHWAVVEARLHNQEMPNGFDASVVYERHYALNWLTYYAEDWDDITTDT